MLDTSSGHQTPLSRLFGLDAIKMLKPTDYSFIPASSKRWKFTHHFTILADRQKGLKVAAVVVPVMVLV